MLHGMLLVNLYLYTSLYDTSQLPSKGVCSSHMLILLRFMEYLTVRQLVSFRCIAMLIFMMLIKAMLRKQRYENFILGFLLETLTNIFFTFC